MPPAQQQALLQYLQANPEAAKQALAQASEIMKTPGLAQQFISMNNPQPDGSQDAAENAERFKFLADDPDMAKVFEDVKANGPGALQKYWEDEELMAKISAKMRAQKINSEPQAPQTPRPPPANLFDAAKAGDVEIAAQFVEKGADIGAKNEKGVTALGIAVGFNKMEMVRFLISKGADLEQRDTRGNSALHYAAGYGRKEIVEVLMDAGASLDAENIEKQKPLDVAKLNKERGVVEFILRRTLGQEKA
jgi:hypothetical protein